MTQREGNLLSSSVHFVRFGRYRGDSREEEEKEMEPEQKQSPLEDAETVNSTVGKDQNENGGATSVDDIKSKGPLDDGDGSDDNGSDNMEDLFGEEEEAEEGEGEGGKVADEDNRYSQGYNEGEEDLNNNDESRSFERRSDIDEEEAMYTRRFYGEDLGNASEQEDTDHLFREEDVELVRRIVPYKAASSTSPTGEGNEEDRHIFYAKVPQFLTIDPIPFDPPNFEAKIKERLTKYTEREDRISDSLIEENTIRWRYSRDANQRVFKESNAQIVKWSDGTYSLKVGDEYTDILVNDTDNTFLAVSHDQQELIQCCDGGEIDKVMMFIPTSTNSKIHQRLSEAVARRNKRVHEAPGTYLVSIDPEVEKKRLESEHNQIIRERRKRQMKELELAENMGGQGGGATGAASGSTAADGFRRSRSSRYGSNTTGATRYRGGRQDEYEEDDFLVDDDEVDEDEGDYGEEDEEEEEEEEEEDDLDDDDEDERRAERLRKMKRGEFESNTGGHHHRRRGREDIDDEEREDDDEIDQEERHRHHKRARAAIVSDDEDE